MENWDILHLKHLNIFAGFFFYIYIVYMKYVKKKIQINSFKMKSKILNVSVLFLTNTLNFLRN